MATIGEELKKYTFAYLTNKALESVTDVNIDKREGSITYDAAAIAAYILAECYSNLLELVLETYAMTASGEYLDKRVVEMGIYRYDASKAVKRADFTITRSGEPYEVPIGSRWSTVDTEEPLSYVVVDKYEDSTGASVDGAFRLECETAGTVGQEYTGEIVPLTYLPQTITATMSDTLTPGRDVETDASVLERYIDRLNYKSFGGNIAQYREWTLAIDGVGAVQVYPAWNGGGTVKLSILDSLFEKCTDEFVADVQNELDPSNVPGGNGSGLGTAPIDHWVTVVTATEKPINIEATIERSDSTKSMEYFTEQTAIVAEEYLLSVRQEWGKLTALNEHDLAVYPAQIMVKMLNIDGIGSVTAITINGADTSLTLTEDAEVQEIPVLGTVTLHEYSANP